jgi:hypothetical protein
MRVTTTFLAFVICNLLTMCLTAKVNEEANSDGRLDLPGKHINVQINHNLTLAVQKPGTGLIWRSSNTHIPDMVVRAGDAESRTLTLASASNFSHAPFKDEKYLGYTVNLSGFEETDVELELIFAIDATADELLIQVSQTGGRDTVVNVGHFYQFEKTVAEGGYLVLPHGSGYLIASDCPDQLPGPEEKKGGFIGARWTLPMFGMTRGDGNAMCAIVETWWDCNVEVEHLPGDRSVFDLNWPASLGKLSYPRRFVLRFAEGMDYVAMAKRYRHLAKEQGLLRTLEEKLTQTPVIQKYVENILFRWIKWDSGDDQASGNCRMALDDIKKLQALGFGVNFFYPKWAQGNHWKAYLLEEPPVPGGWKALAKLASDAHQLDCPVQCFINHRTHSAHNAVDGINRLFDHVQAKGLEFDVLYFDGYSAHDVFPEDTSPDHPVTRRQSYEIQNACFAETRHRGVMPAAELARFWCMADCDYFFFTDWARDRLSAGDPIPLFQLVFNDCYSAGFSGGGYAFYAPGHDWPHDRTPRLYELMFASAPAYNWLPEPHAPIRDWNGDQAKRRWAWLKRWSSYYRAVTLSEMVSHEFLSPDRTKCRVEFANGVTADFNLADNKFRVKGVTSFTGQWETPEELPGYP